MLWQCPRLKWMPLTLHIFEPFSHAFLLLLKVVRNCTAWAKVLGGLPRIPAKKALPLFLGRMQSSRSFKRGNKSSSPGREMKDKTKRIKCFGCEHISFHFLLLVTNNAPIFRGGMSRETSMQKYSSGVFWGPWQSKGTPSTVLQHPANFLFPEMLAGKDVPPLQGCTKQSLRRWGGQFQHPLPQRLQCTSKAHTVLHGQKMKTCHIPIKWIAASIPSKRGNDNCNLHANHLRWAPGPKPCRAQRPQVWPVEPPSFSGCWLNFTFSRGAGGRGERKRAFLGLSSQ